MQRKQHLFKLIVLLITVALFMVACGQSEEDDNGQVSFPEVEENPVVTIVMEDDQKITVELYPEIAPNTVANFISLIEAEFYDGLTFHRVIPGFMIQGGDPNGNGTGGPGYAIAGEFVQKESEEDIIHERGVISMARSASPDSAGSQFFIIHEDSPHLDGQYAAFGKVIEGMEVVDYIVHLRRDANDKPEEDYPMKSVTVDTKGVDYPEPVKQ